METKMRHLKSLEEFRIVNEQLFKDGEALMKLLSGGKLQDSPVEGSLAIKGGSISGDKAKNAQAVINSMNKHGIKNPYTQKAILGVIGKECGFMPQNETSYSNTSSARIRSIFGERVSKMTDAQIDQLKKNDEAFYNYLYGGRYGNAPNEGYKYRGRGFNGITFKGVYQKMQNLLDKIGKLDRKVDIVANPDVINDIDVAAETVVLYFLDRASNPSIYKKYGVKDLNGFKDEETAVKAMVHANAGWGANMNSPFLVTNLNKAKEMAQQFSIADLGQNNLA
jgi:putative chitinase